MRREKRREISGNRHFGILGLAEAAGDLLLDLTHAQVELGTYPRILLRSYQNEECLPRRTGIFAVGWFPGDPDSVVRIVIPPTPIRRLVEPVPHHVLSTVLSAKSFAPTWPLGQTKTISTEFHLPGRLWTPRRARSENIFSTHCGTKAAPVPTAAHPRIAW